MFTDEAPLVGIVIEESDELDLLVVVELDPPMDDETELGVLLDMLGRVTTVTVGGASPLPTSESVGPDLFDKLIPGFNFGAIELKLIFGVETDVKVLCCRAGTFFAAFMW